MALAFAPLTGLQRFLGAYVCVGLTKGLLVVMAVACVSALLPARRRDLRHRLWALALVAAALLPLVWLSGLRVRLANPGGVLAQVLFRILSVPFLPDTADVPSALSVPTGSPWEKLWLVGVSVLALEGLARYMAAVRLVRTSYPAPAFEARARRAALALPTPLSAGVQIALNARASRPVSVGVLRPRLILPAAAESWPAARLLEAVTHQMAHIRRADGLSRMIADVIRVLLWFLPPVWLAHGLMVREAERTCRQPSPETGRAVSGTRGPPPAREVWLLLFPVALVLLLAMTPRTEERLSGVWVEREAATEHSLYVWREDGTGAAYGATDPQAAPMRELRYTVDRSWTDLRGQAWYIIRARWSDAPYRESRAVQTRLLVRMDPAGVIREDSFLGGWEGDPSPLDRIAWQYHFRRQVPPGPETRSITIPVTGSYAKYETDGRLYFRGALTVDWTPPRRMGGRWVYNTSFRADAVSSTDGTRLVVRFVHDSGDDATPEGRLRIVVRTWAHAPGWRTRGQVRLDLLLPPVVAEPRIQELSFVGAYSRTSWGP